MCQRVCHEGRGEWEGVVMSVQQGEVVGEVEFWPRPRPRVWLKPAIERCTAGGRLVQ